MYVVKNEKPLPHEEERLSWKNQKIQEERVNNLPRR